MHGFSNFKIFKIEKSFTFWYNQIEYIISIPIVVFPHILSVFKKRPNFLNSAPTSTESALRLLSTPICKLGKNFTETFQLLNQTYGEDCMSRRQCYEWFKRFKEGRMSVSEDPSPGRPSTLTNDDHVERVRAVIRGNRRLTVREVADDVGISIESCHQIFTDKLQMRRDSAKFVPRFLTDDQKENRVEISQELLANANGNENFLKNIITGDETWVYGYDVETKMHSSQWMGKGSPRPKKAGMSR